MPINFHARTRAATPSTRRATAALLTVAGLTLAACSSNKPAVESTPASAQDTTVATDSLTTPVSEVVNVADGWARSMPGGKGAVYAKITSPVDDAIVSASVEPSAAAPVVEIHEVVTDTSGKMSMRMVERIPLAAGSVTELKPGSYHIMMMGMPEVLSPGTELRVTLTLASGRAVSFTAVVRDEAGAMGDDSHGSTSEDQMDGSMDGSMGDSMDGSMDGNDSDGGQ